MIAEGGFYANYLARTSERWWLRCLACWAGINPNKRIMMADDGDIRKRVSVVTSPLSFGGCEINVIIYVIEWAPPFKSSEWACFVCSGVAT